MSLACAVVAESLAPGASAWWVAGHRSTEPAQAHALKSLGLEPLLDLGMRLGEGSGAVAALPVLRSGIAVLRDVALLSEILPPCVMLRDAWLLATGTLTAVRVPPPARVDRPVAGLAMVLAPLAVLPLAAAAALVVLVGDWLGLPPLATAYVVVLALALGTRAFHWDGLADTADGLTASYSPERSLEVMRTGPVGPAGVVAVVLVTGLQAAGLAAVVRARARLVGGRPPRLRLARVPGPGLRPRRARRPR